VPCVIDARATVPRPAARRLRNNGLFNPVKSSRSHDSVYEHLPLCDGRTALQQTWSFNRHSHTHTHFFQPYANVLDTAHQTHLRQKVQILLFLTCPPITLFYSGTYWLLSHLHSAPWTCFLFLILVCLRALNTQMC
jgi:hypothetical protein